MQWQTYTKSDKESAVRLVEAGHSVDEVLGIPHVTLWNWVHLDRKGRGVPSQRRPEQPSEQIELHLLRKRISELEQENEFLG